MANFSTLLRAGVFALALSSAYFTSSAAVVSWGAPTTISGDSDVSTSGTLLGAVNWGFSSAGIGNPTTTVNGVTFIGGMDGYVAGSSGPFSWTQSTSATIAP